MWPNSCRANLDDNDNDPGVAGRRPATAAPDLRFRLAGTPTSASYPTRRTTSSPTKSWINQAPAEITENPDLLRLSLPAHRSDFELVETYEYRAGEPLDRPLTVIGGTDDELTESELAAWGRHTATRLDLQLLPGGHFYLREQRDRLLHLVRERLRLSPIYTGCQAGR